MKWITRFTVTGPNKHKPDEQSMIEMLELLRTLGKCKHFSFNGWSPRRGG